MRRNGTLIAAVLFIVVLPVHAVITRPLELKLLLAGSAHVCMVKVEKIDPDRPGMVLTVDADLKGKIGPRRWAVNLTGDDEAMKSKHTAELLKRVAVGTPLLVFVEVKSDDKLDCFAFTEGTWINLHADRDGESFRWGFMHCEPYLRRTFKGTTAELREVIEKAIKDKKPLPRVDPKVEPGFGPELKQKKEGSSLSLPGAPLFGVIVGLPAGGIIGVLALLFPAVFGGLAIVMRRWAALVTVVFTNSTLFFCYITWQDQFWWTTQKALWIGILLVTLAGAGWAWIRQLRFLDPDSTEPEMPARTERIALFVLSAAAAAGLVALVFMNQTSSDLSTFLWITGAGFWAGTLYVVVPKTAQFERRALPTEGLALGCMAAVAILLTARGASANVQGERDLTSDSTTDSKKGYVLNRQMWTFSPQGQSDMASSPVVAGKYVYIGAIEGLIRKIGRLYCLDRETGKEVWHFDNKGTMKQMYSTPFIADGKLYIGEGFHENNECNLFCLDASTGKLLWAFNTASEEENKPWGDFPTNSHVESSPFVASGRVYVGAGDKGLYCIDATSGKKVWQYPEAGDRRNGLHIDSNPVVVGDRVYCCSGKSRTFNRLEVFCVDIRTGKKIWSHPTELPAWGSPTVHEGRVYVGLGDSRIGEKTETAKGDFLCLDAFTGERQWNYDQLKGAVHTKPVIDGNLVIFGSQDDYCYALDCRKGTMVWKRDLGSMTVSSPVLVRGAWEDAPGALYVAAMKGDVYCLDPKTGEVHWCFDELSKGGKEGKGFAANLLTAPFVTVRRTSKGEQRRIYFASGIYENAGSVLYCLEDKWNEEE
jgi:outer membrane protein assembly factor BamB